jgi:hypothetical protein
MKKLVLPAFPWLAVLILLVATAIGAEAQVTWSSSEDCKCVDANGEEIGNCVCIVTPGEGMANWQIAPFGRQKARMGITLSVSVDDEDVRGPKVESVLEDGPADRAGIEEGDIITHFDGRSVFEPLSDPDAEEDLDLDDSVPAQRLLHLAQHLEPGQEVEIRYLRNGEDFTTTLVAEELDDWGATTWTFSDNWGERWDPEELEERMGNFYVWRKDQAPFAVYRGLNEDEEGGVFSFGPDGRKMEIRHGGWLGFGDYFNTCPDAPAEDVVFLGSSCLGGISTQELNADLGAYFGTDDGVLVLDVHEDSKLGLSPGDVILKIGDRDVTNPGALNRILRSYEADEEITLTVMRESREMNVSGTLGR